jgi:hypothetical protein
MAQTKLVSKQYLTLSTLKRKHLSLTLNVIYAPFLSMLLLFSHRPASHTLGKVYIEECLCGKATIKAQHYGLFLHKLHRRWERQRNEARKQLPGEGTSQIKDIPEVDLCKIEHGGGAYGCPGRRTISRTRTRFLHHHVLRPSACSYHPSFKKCQFAIRACLQCR